MKRQIKELIAQNQGGKRADFYSLFEPVNSGDSQNGKEQKRPSNESDLEN